MSSQPPALVKVDILGVSVNAQSFEGAICTMLDWARQPQGRYICTCAVGNVMSAQDNETIRRAINGADMVTADGMPLVWVQRRLGYPHAERVYGPDLMMAFCERSAAQGIRHYLWGGLPGIADRLTETLTSKIPTIQIVGSYAPPMGPVGTIPDPQVVEKLNASGADVIWVGLGTPKQDLWMQLYRPVLKAPLLIAVGAAFDFISGVKPQAPRWMQQNGLEWTFRLVTEPRRLWRRYLVNNPRFMWGVLRQHVLHR